MLETWRRQHDGTFELDEDRFKIEEVFPAPRVATPEETVSIVMIYSSIMSNAKNPDAKLTFRFDDNTMAIHYT